jgi:hypothetical protein
MLPKLFFLPLFGGWAILKKQYAQMHFLKRPQICWFFSQEKMEK